MADSGFLIDGTHYEVPTLDSFTMNEAEILYKCSGLALEDFAIDEEDPEAVSEFRAKTRNPGFLKALMTVAYIRGNSGTPVEAANRIIGAANLIDAMKALGDVAEADVDPPAVGADSAPENDSSSNDPSGGTSTSGSDEPDESLVPIGTSA